MMSADFSVYKERVSLILYHLSLDKNGFYKSRDFLNTIKKTVREMARVIDLAKMQVVEY